MDQAPIDPDAYHVPYPGPEIWAKLARLVFAPGDTLNEFIEMRNPTSRGGAAIVFLGPGDPDLQLRLERHFHPKDPLPDETLKQRILSRQLVRKEYARCKVTWAPGEAHWVPKAWGDSLRKVVNGKVVSGQFWRLEVVGEENPPPIHPALLGEDEEEPRPVRRGRSRT